ncbi:hypothetical protein V6U71_17635 [Sphingopyxis sp. J-6]|uniref:hypothetical protein n=1 Tax=Sphingopyxis sp. J-6 TaxID=3122054 RepID=UPI0039844712
MKFATAMLLPAVLAAAGPAVAASENLHPGKGAKTALPAPVATQTRIAASDTDFSSCDGYAAPKGKTDGISRENFFFGATRSADIRRSEIYSIGESGLAACDRTLADPRLVDDFWLRRANLMQAKALHSIAAKQPEQALVLVAESNALGTAHDERYFVQSIGVGNEGVLAYALIALGRRDEAKAAIERLRRSRPWAQSIQQLATRLQLHLDSGFAGQAAELKGAIPLSPEKAEALFWMEFLYGNYAEARDIAPSISFDLPKQRGGWTLRGADEAALKAIGSRNSFYGAWAYAETVAGHDDRSHSLLAEANKELDEIMVPPPPRSDGRPPKKQDVEDYRRREPHAVKARDELALWKAAIAFRPMIALKPVDVTEVEFSRKRLNTLPIMPDVLANLPQQSAAEKAEVDGVMANIRNRLEEERITALDLPVDELLPLLPRPETPKVVPTLKPAGDGSFLSDSGLTRNREGSSDVWTIRYTHRLAPMAAVEELAMLGAAQSAQQAGFDSLLLLGRLSISRTTNVVGWTTGSYNSGYEAQMRVRFVNANALPEDLGGAAWRLIPAQRVIDDLGNRYRPGGLTIAW